MDNLESEQEQQMMMLATEASQQDDLRTICLYGDVSEKMCGDMVSALSFLKDNSLSLKLKDPEDEESEIIKEYKPINMIVSTLGGSAPEMFSVYDMMRYVKQVCDIETFGIGKVMSAGVPILAAGSPGRRFVGKHCRIMLHSVMAGTGGTIFNMENELEEIKWIQDRYIESLVENTKLTKAKIRKMLKTQRDIYISAEEAIKLGIADEII